jgi:hypothetical protein
MIAFSVFTIATAQQPARVNKVNVYDIYMFSTPSVPYEELYQVSGFWNWSSRFFGYSLDNIAATMVRNANKKQPTGAKATGLIVKDKKHAVAIRVK